MGVRGLITVMFVALVSVTAVAELQSVQVGGQIRIRGNYMNLDSLGASSFVEQRSSVNVLADFTQDVSMFIELDNYNAWGYTNPDIPFTSWYLCGNDFRGGTNDIYMYQAYIEVRNMWDSRVTMRVGRQEISLGNEFLIGVNDVSSLFYGRPFDALRLTYGNDEFSVDAIAVKLTENFGDFGKEDADLYILYSSYMGIENVVLDAYWMYVRDDDGVVGQVLLDAGDIDLHTLGLRGAGTIGAFDFEVEAAYQLGNVEDVRNPWFRLFDRRADVDIDEFAVNAELGYTFDTSMQPRIFAHFAYFGGGNPDDSWWSNDRTLPFSRMYSNVQYSEFLDDWTGSNGALSNVFVYGLGVQAQMSETVGMKLVASYLEADEALNRCNDDTTLGWEIGLYGDYAYSEDLIFRVGYAHFFGDDGLEAAPVRWSGLIPWQSDKDDDYDYLFIESEITF
ncbi:MAG: alginate export family protein [Candidatus Hydrogenedentes bacterium]|nr:alginate export family protein [Candidatus Hydrogenedentota bacterium]